MRYAVVNLGCKVNRVESDGYEALLEELGWIHSAEDGADLIIVNTCTVTGEAEKKTRKAVRSALRNPRTRRVVVTGCAAAVDPQTFTAMDPRVEVVPKAATEQRLACIAKAMADQADAAEPSEPCPVKRIRRGVKVQDGCDNACTYCIVHVARGPALSRSADAVAADCRALAASGIPEIMLTGINLGSYRSEEGGLAALLRRLMAETQTPSPTGTRCRFRISSVEPMDADDALFEAIAYSQGRICRHLHLPLQSGSDSVLSAMGRPYDAEEYLDLVRRARNHVEGLSLSTDIIVGFPGETEEDFGQTLAVAEACGFSKIHVFPYSQRKGTPAALMDDQVDPAVKSRRAEMLRDLASKLRQRDWQSRAGTVEQAVVERPGRARTESYYEVPVDSALAPGALVSLRLPQRYLS